MRTVRIAGLAIVAAAITLMCPRAMAEDANMNPLFDIEPSAGVERVDGYMCLEPMVPLLSQEQMKLPPQAKLLEPADRFIVYTQHVAAVLQAEAYLEKLTYKDRFAFVKLATPRGGKNYFMVDNKSNALCNISETTYDSVAIRKETRRDKLPAMPKL